MRAAHLTTTRSGRIAVAVTLAVALALSMLAFSAPAADAARNKAPKLKPIATQTVRAGQVLTVKPRASDPDRGPKKLRFSAKGRPSWLKLNARTGVLKGRAPLTSAGRKWRVTLRVTDGRAARSRAFTVRVAANQAPQLAAIGDQTVAEGAQVAVRPSAVDPDRGPRPLRFSVSYAAQGDAPSTPTWLRLDAATGALTGTAPAGSGGDRWRVTISVTDGLRSVSRTFTLAVSTTTPANRAPEITEVTPASVEGTVGEPVDADVRVTAADPDGDDLEFAVTGLPAGLSATVDGGTVTVSGIPSAPGRTTATITASDPDGASDTADLAVVIAEAPAPVCTPRSTLSCAEVPVELPLSLTFDGDEGGLKQTGFTMVDAPSTRNNVDQAPAPADPTHADVPGFEPSLVTTAGGELRLSATKGIMYRTPAGSPGTNSQLNALGVGVSGAERGYEVETTLPEPTFASSGADSSTASQQGGLWFGLGEDDYVKAAVVRLTATTSKVQLVTEVDGTATPATTHELNSAAFPAGQDVRLVLRVEDTAGAGGTVSLRYAVNGGALTQLTDTANTVNSTALPIPQELLDGVSPAAGEQPVSFAGLFATKRNAAASDEVVVPFAGFEVRELVQEPEVEVHEKYSFTTTADTGVPAGYTKNDGAPWADAAGIGWVTQASLAEASHAPVDLRANTRVRTRPAPVTALQNRLIHLQYGDVDGGAGTNGNKTPGAFERAVPDGWYQVKVSVGDQMGSSAYDSQHSVNVEGVPAITRFQPTAAQEYQTATVTARVTDGRLTIDAIGGTNTKLNYVEIDSATAPAEPDVHAKVRFADEASAPPAGYVKDFGQAYGARTGADQGTDLTYGWSAIATKQPVSIVGNGRNRNTGAGAPAGVSALQAGLMHMQLPENATGGVKTPAYWEMAVPNGTYAVSVSTGDATSVDSEAWLNIEGQNAIAEFVPTGANGAATHWATATRTVSVTDGRLTVTPEGGVNTKINWVTLDSVAGASQRPAVLKCTPANLATAVNPTGGVVCDLRLIGDGVDSGTLAGSVRLIDVATGDAVDGTAQTSGGTDTINFSPTRALAPNTTYRLEIGDGVRDGDGRSFLPYATAFTTGVTSGGGPVAFDRIDSGAATGKSYTSITVGPDGRLYAGSITGEIYRFPINADGTLGTPQVIKTVQTYSASAASGDTYRPGTRTVIGLAFDPASTAANPILWITDNAPFLGPSDVPDSSGRLAKLTGPDLGTYTAVLDGLPRSVKDHETNSLAFGPDGAIYFSQGANNAMGAPDGAWGNRAERLLSAAVLRLDITKLPSPLPARGLNVRTGDAGSYNPFAPDAPLTIYARGIRNAYDLVWHSNGHLYVPTNGSAAGGNVPGVPADADLPATCANRPDGTYLGRPKVAAVTSNPEETDYVFDVRKDRYYGHPNPSRCEYVLNNGNPTAGKDKFENSKYPVGTLADPNYDLAGVYDAGLHASANGAIEYRGGAFGGALNGKLLYVRYSNGSDIVSFDVAPDGTLSNQTFGLTGTTNMRAPLDLAQDVATGNLYVTEMTQDGSHSAIRLLKPQGGGGGPVATATDRLVFSGPTGATSATRNAVVENAGVEPLVVTGASLAGAAAGQFTQPSAPSYPVTVPAGQRLSIPVAFKPTSTGVKAATLEVATDAGPRTVRLRGLAAAGLGGGNEPGLQAIMDTLEIPIDVGDSTSSTTGMIGDEVPAQLFTKARSDAPISIEPIAAYGPQNVDPAIKVGWYDAGNPAGLHQQYTVAAKDVQGLMIDPTGTTTNIDPGEETVFGLYSEWPYFSGRRTFTEDRLNTWDATHPHHMRVYPLKGADGAVVPDAYVVATEEVPGATFDTQDLVLIVRNVKPQVPSASDAVAKVVNVDPTPFEDQVAFSRIQTQADANQRVADTGRVRVSNTGTEAMQVTGLDVTGAFALEGAPTVPFTLAPGASQEVTIRFTATSTRVHTGALTVRSNAGNGAQTIRLGGLWQSLSENGQEPVTVQIARAFGIGTDIPTALNANGHVEAVGDEVLSPYWLRRDTTKPVTVRQLAGYHTYPNGATISRFDKGASGKTTITNMNNLWAQSLLPPRSGSTTQPALGTFTPGSTAFGFDVDNEKTDPALNSHTADRANGCVEPCGHHVRMFPVEDRDGVAVPGAYLLMMDYSGINYDYNDNVYLITNIRPEKLPTPQGVATSAGDGKVTVSWSPSADSDVRYRVWRDTDPDVPADAAHLVSGPDALTGTSFTDTGLTNGTTYYYVVRAVIPNVSNSDSSPAVAATPNAVGAFAAKINFQSAAAPVPAGYLRDFGQAFGARTDADQGSGRSYGWLTQASRQPVDLSVGGSTNAGNGRDRDLASDQRLDTFMHMQGEDVPNFNGRAVNGLWEIAVPDGRYAVTLAVGDPSVNSDPERHRINVEGVNAIEGFVPTGAAGSANRHASATVTVTVSDGRLTIDALGGTNTKIDYVDIAAVTTP